MQWKGLGKPAGSKGWKYKGAGSPTDPCTVVLVKANVIKHVCKGSGITLAPPVVGALGVVLNVGDQRYCAAFGGRTVKNKPGNFKRKHAPAPSTCPVPCGTLLTKWGGCGSGDGQFGQPVGVAVDGSGNVYVSDRFIGPVCPAVGSAAIQKFTNSGTFLTKWGSMGSGDGQFSFALGVGVDANGNVFVADGAETFNEDTPNNNRVQKFTNTGTFLAKWGSGGSGDGEFNHPTGVAVDGSGNVYVSDCENNRVQKFTNDGTFLTKWGSFGSGDGQLDCPSGLRVDGSGNVFVTDVNNNRIQKFTDTGTFLAKWGSFGSGDGQLNAPLDVAVDGSGNVYVTDGANERIEKFTNTGTFLAKWGSGGVRDGQFLDPTGIVVDGSGNVYVVDFSRVQKFACQ